MSNVLVQADTKFLNLVNLSKQILPSSFVKADC